MIEQKYEDYFMNNWACYKKSGKRNSWCTEIVFALCRAATLDKNFNRNLDADKFWDKTMPDVERLRVMVDTIACFGTPRVYPKHFAMPSSKFVSTKTFSKDRDIAATTEYADEQFCKSYLDELMRPVNVDSKLYSVVADCMEEIFKIDNFTSPFSTDYSMDNFVIRADVETPESFGSLGKYIDNDTAKDAGANKDACVNIVRQRLMIEMVKLLVALTNDAKVKQVMTHKIRNMGKVLEGMGKVNLGDISFYIHDKTLDSYFERGSRHAIEDVDFAKLLAMLDYVTNCKVAWKGYDFYKKKIEEC